MTKIMTVDLDLSLVYIYNTLSQAIHYVHVAKYKISFWSHKQFNSFVYCENL